MKLLFDIEADALLDQATKVHSLVIEDLGSGRVYSCADQPGYIPIEEGRILLAQAQEVWGHNIIDYDLPVLEKVYGLKIKPHNVRDTLVISRLIYAHMKEVDFRVRPRNLPKRLYGRHSLESWGYRLGFPKGNHSDWSTWSKEMQTYCEQDVLVNKKIIEYFNNHEYSQQAITLEHQFKYLIAWQEKMGVPFDVEAARALRRDVEPQIQAAHQALVDIVPPWVKETVFIPKRDNRTLGYKKGVPFTKRIEEPFNPGSRVQIIKYLKKQYGWEPTEFTDKGNPKIDRDVLGKLIEWKEVAMLSDYLDMAKLAGQVWRGKNAWLKHVKDGRIYGKVNTNGAVTGRCTHSHPNLGQVPTVRSYKGRECRACFTALPGFKMVGADASGLELRTLSHYLIPYDGGRYGELVTTGDVHTANQEAGGLPTRDDAKTFIYALLYGAGDAKLGSILEPTASECRQKHVGKELRRQFYAKIPAIQRLVDDVRRVYKQRGFLRGLDGRKLFPRGAHQALNTLCQGAGAVIMKQAMVLKWEAICSAKLDAYPALNVHDEFQDIVREDHALTVGEMAVQAIRDSAAPLRFNIPLDGEYKIGNNWAETH